MSRAVTEVLIAVLRCIMPACLTVPNEDTRVGTPKETFKVIFPILQKDRKR